MRQRLAYCPHTKQLILQQYVPEDEDKWLCLHRETREEELQEINSFKRNVIYSFYETYSYLRNQVSFHDLLEAYLQVPNKEDLTKGELLDRMKDIILPKANQPQTDKQEIRRDLKNQGFLPLDG